MGKVTTSDAEKLRAAALKALLGFMPDVMELNPEVPVSAVVATPPLSTGQHGEVTVTVLPLVDIEPLKRSASELELATRLYIAYNDQGPNPWKTFDGRSVPPFSEVGDQVRGKWLAVARTSRRVFG